MPTYQTTPVWTEILDAPQLSKKALGYFRARLKNRLHQLVLTEFLQLEANKAFNRADLARRIGKRPEQITRLLGAPGNWELDTVSDLLLAMGYELEPKAVRFDNKGFHVVTSMDWPLGPTNGELKNVIATTTSG
jgi:DNA-binding phage protein